MPATIHSHQPDIRQIGDVIQRDLDGSLPGVHFGVRVASTNGITDVVHLTLGSTPLRCTEIEFGAGKRIAVSGLYARMIRQNQVDRELIAKRALSAIGSEDWRYSVLNQDCDAFVQWCVTGKKDLGIQARIYKSTWSFLKVALEFRNAMHRK